MAFTLSRLIGNTDIASPSLEDVASRLDGSSSFAVEGHDDDDKLGRFQAEISGGRVLVQVEGLKDRDQFVLIDRSLGEELVRFLVDEEDNQYPAFCFPSKELILHAMKHFSDTGKRSTDCDWISISELLGQYVVIPE
jgi:hypothetical protein